MVEQYFRKVEVSGSNPEGGSINLNMMNNKFIKIIRNKDLDLSIWVFLGLSILTHIFLWILRSQLIFFNSAAIYVGLVILVLNFTLIFLYNSKDYLVGYILGFSAFLAQILLLILLIKSGQLI